MLPSRRARLGTVAATILIALASEAPASAQGKTTTTLIQRGGALFEDQQYEESIQTLSAALLRPGSSEAEKIFQRLLELAGLHVVGVGAETRIPPQGVVRITATAAPSTQRREV